MEDAGELDRDIARAHNHDLLRQRVQMKRFVGRDRKLPARYFRNEGVAAGCDQNALGADGAVFAHELHAVRPNNLSAVLDHRAASGLNTARVDFAEAFDFGVFIGDKGLPVEALFADCPSVAACVVDGMAKLACIDEELLRHAAADHAGAAEAIFLGNRRAHAKACSKPRRPDAARAAADNEQIVVEFNHDLP